MIQRLLGGRQRRPIHLAGIEEAVLIQCVGLGLIDGHPRQQIAGGLLEPRLCLLTQGSEPALGLGKIAQIEGARPPQVVAERAGLGRRRQGREIRQSIGLTQTDQRDPRLGQSLLLLGRQTAGLHRPQEGLGHLGAIQTATPFQPAIPPLMSRRQGGRLHAQRLRQRIQRRRLLRRRLRSHQFADSKRHRQGARLPALRIPPLQRLLRPGWSQQGEGDPGIVVGGQVWQTGQATLLGGQLQCQRW